MLKKAITIVLPAGSTLYFALSQTWHLPRAEDVVGSVAAVTAFLGMLLGVSTKSYNSSDAKYVGDLVVENHPEDESKQILVAHLNQDPEAVKSMSEATFKVSGN